MAPKGTFRKPFNLSAWWFLIFWAYGSLHAKCFWNFEQHICSIKAPLTYKILNHKLFWKYHFCTFCYNRAWLFMTSFLSREISGRDLKKTEPRKSLGPRTPRSSFFPNFFNHGRWSSFYSHFNSVSKRWYTANHQRKFSWWTRYTDWIFKNFCNIFSPCLLGCHQYVHHTFHYLFAFIPSVSSRLKIFPFVHNSFVNSLVSGAQDGILIPVIVSIELCLLTAPSSSRPLSFLNCPLLYPSPNVFFVVLLPHISNVYSFESHTFVLYSDLTFCDIILPEVSLNPALWNCFYILW